MELKVFTDFDTFIDKVEKLEGLLLQYEKKKKSREEAVEKENTYYRCLDIFSLMSKWERRIDALIVEAETL